MKYIPSDRPGAKGFFRTGYISNKNDILDILSKKTGLSRIDFNRLNQSIDHQLDERSYQTRDGNFAIVPLDSDDTKYVLFDTDFTTPEGEILYGGLCSTAAGDWVGVALGTEETLQQYYLGQTPAAPSRGLYTDIFVGGKESLCEIYNRMVGADYGVNEFIVHLDAVYTKAKSEGRVFVAPYGKYQYFLLHEEPAVWAYSLPNERSNPKWFGIYLTDTENMREMVFECSCYNLGKMVFANSSECEAFIQALHDEATPEDWDFAGDDRHRILRNYIQYTYLKLYREDEKETDASLKKIRCAKDGETVFFNTGLLTTYFRQIYIRAKKAEVDFPFAGGYEKMDVIQDMQVVKERDAAAYIRRLDDLRMPKYFTDLSDLIYNPEYNLSLNDEHIFEDGLARKRLPRYFEEYKACRDDEAKLNRLYQRIASDFDGALDNIRLLAERNYKLAIPVYFIEKDCIQLLLPIYIDADLSRPECALAVELDRSGDYPCYIGRTILTLDMAYNNSRLIAKPDVFWLTKENRCLTAETQD